MSSLIETKVYPGAIDNASFNASKYGSNALELSNAFPRSGGAKKSRKPKTKKNKTRKTYKRRRVGKGRRTRNLQYI